MPGDQPSAVSGAFRRPFPEQVAFFRLKMRNLVPTARWDDMTGAAHDTGFMVAGAQKADLLADLAAAIERAIAEGRGLEAFRKDFSAAVERHDWRGWTGEGTAGGRAWRTRVIYRTNAYVSYSAGRRAQLEAASWPLWVYLHGGSADPRHEHLHVFHGLVLPPDHPFWVKFFPPSDWGCSCYVVGARSERGARRLGGDPSRTLPDGWDKVDPATGEPAGIGRGWGYAPGASVVQAVNDKLKTWPAQITADFAASLPVQLRLPLDLPEPPIVSVRQLTAEERETFHTYTGPHHRRINDGLRDDPPVIEPEVATMTDVLSRSRLGETVTVYRGLKWEAALKATGLEPGDIYIDAGFVSTSRLRSKGEDFRAADPRDGVLMIISVPRGARALDIEPVSQYGEEEREILLQRGTRLEVVSWDDELRILEVRLAADR